MSVGASSLTLLLPGENSQSFVPITATRLVLAGVLVVSLVTEPTARTWVALLQSVPSSDGQAMVAPPPSRQVTGPWVTVPLRKNEVLLLNPVGELWYRDVRGSPGWWAINSSWPMPPRSELWWVICTPCQVPVGELTAAATIRPVSAVSVVFSMARRLPALSGSRMSGCPSPVTSP